MHLATVGAFLLVLAGSGLLINFLRASPLGDFNRQAAWLAMIGVIGVIAGHVSVYLVAGEAVFVILFSSFTVVTAIACAALTLNRRPLPGRDPVRAQVLAGATASAAAGVAVAAQYFWPDAWWVRAAIIAVLAPCLVVMFMTVRRLTRSAAQESE